MSVFADTAFALEACRREITALAARLGVLLHQQALTVTTAESCTGGGIAEAITRIAGSSHWFGAAWVTYSNQAKVAQLEVSPKTLVRHGAVSVEVVQAMARSALTKAGADWAIAVSGIAGPDGGSAEKPVGLVCFAWAGVAGVTSETQVFGGDREAVRAQTVRHALQQLIKRIDSSAIQTPMP